MAGTQKQPIEAGLSCINRIMTWVKQSFLQAIPASQVVLARWCCTHSRGFVCYIWYTTFNTVVVVIVVAVLACLWVF